MSELNRLKVVDFTAGRLSSDDINTDIPFADNFAKTRTIQQANAVIGAYVNRNYEDMSNKADIDDIPTKTSQLENDSGYITTGDIPSKTSDLTNDGDDGEHPFITNQVNDLVNYTTSSDLNDLLGPINNDITDLQDDVYDLNGDIAMLSTAVDLQLPGRVGDLVVGSVRTKNIIDANAITQGTVSASDGTWASSGIAVVSDYIEVKANQQYTIKLNNVDDNQYLFRVVLYSPNKNYNSALYTNISPSDLVTILSFTPTIDGYVRICFGKDNWSNLMPIDIIKAKPQLEKGTATSFREYQNLTPAVNTYNTSVVLTGNRIKINDYSIFSGTLVSTFSSGIVDLNVTSLHLDEKPTCVQLTISSSLYSMQYDYDNSSATSLKIKLVSNNAVANVNGNVRYSIIIIAKTNDY